MTHLYGALDFLQKNPLRYLVHLKYLHLYADQMGYFHTQFGESHGLLLHHAPSMTSWDSATYSNTVRIFLPTATTIQAAARTLDIAREQYPNGTPLVFKFCDELTQAVYRSAYPMLIVRTLISYTAPQHISGQAQTFPVWEDVIVTQTPDEACIALVLENGYSRGEIDRFFAEGAQAFSIYEEGEPVCICLAYHNFGDIWEIGGVRTLERAQRRGLARRVVQTALHTLAVQKRIPRYQAESTNVPSIRLAESIGLVPCLRFEHYRSSFLKTPILW